MSIQSRQAVRLIKFIAELKKNNYPNASSFAKLLRQADLEENIACACSVRTVMRDIETLQTEYHAPIEYDAANHGYYLTDPSWELQAPVLSDDILSMTLLGTKLASDILPEPIRAEVESAVEKVLANNSSEFFDEAMIQSMLCATGIKAAVDPMVFKKIFDAWRHHQVLKIIYTKPNAVASERLFEPHIIAFYHGIWYIKGYDFGKKDAKSLAIQRITEAFFAGKSFITDKKLLEDTRRNGLFEYPKIEGIRLKCDASISFYLREHQKTKKFTIEPQDDGSLIVTLQPSIEHEVIKWILGEAGHIEVLQPLDLRRKVAEAAKKILEKNS